MTEPADPRTPLDGTMDMVQVCAEITGGNPGAITVVNHVARVLKENYERDDQDYTLEEVRGAMQMFLLTADDMNLRGPHLWRAYKDCCEHNAAALVQRVVRRDPELINQLLYEYDPNDYTTPRQRGAHAARAPHDPTLSGQLPAIDEVIRDEWPD